MAAKLKVKVEINHICNYCNQEIQGGYEYVKTKRGTELYICRECVNKSKRENA